MPADLCSSQPASTTGDPAARIFERARELVDDISLHAVSEWKAANPGGLAVGYMPVWVPRPLLESLGCLPVAIFGGGDLIEVIRGDSYYQSYICHIPRSTIDMAVSGRLNALDGMIFPSTCDVIRNLSGMWQVLFPDKYVAYLDLPQNLDAAQGGLFLRQEMTRIADELHRRGARPLDTGALNAAIEAENERRHLIARLDEIRMREPARLRGSEAYLAVRAGASLSCAAHIAFLHEVLEAVGRRQARTYDNVRVVAVGAFCEQQPYALIRALENAGCDIIADDFQLAFRYLDGDIPAETADPTAALADAFVHAAIQTATRYDAADGRGAALVNQVRKLDAAGVVLCAASFCDPALLDQPMLERALQQAGIPFTSYKFAENSGQHHTVREQAGAFCDAVKLWGQAR